MIKEIGIIGDFHNSRTQSTIADSIEHSNKSLGFKTEFRWIDTELLDEDKYNNVLSGIDGIWSAPGSPFKSLTGALNAIRFARENYIPHLATCAGYQNSIIEIARDMLGYKNAQNGEYSDNIDDLFIDKLSCSLKGTSSKVVIKENTYTHKIYNQKEIEANYFCNYGLNNKFQESIAHEDIIISGIDCNNAIRIIELRNHPFFIATVYVPQVASTYDKPEPLITEFIKIINN
jgi:CTP synthase (UTP-ammonia lyase)